MADGIEFNMMDELRKAVHGRVRQGALAGALAIITATAKRIAQGKACCEAHSADKFFNDPEGAQLEIVECLIDQVRGLMKDPAP